MYFRAASAIVLPVFEVSVCTLNPFDEGVYEVSALGVTALSTLVVCSVTAGERPVACDIYFLAA